VLLLLIISYEEYQLTRTALGELVIDDAAFINVTWDSDCLLQPLFLLLCLLLDVVGKSPALCDLDSLVLFLMCGPEFRTAADFLK